MDSDCSYKYRSYLICVIRLIHDIVVNYKITYYASVVTKIQSLRTQNGYESTI